MLKYAPEDLRKKVANLGMFQRDWDWVKGACGRAEVLWADIDEQSWALICQQGVLYSEGKDAFRKGLEEGKFRGQVSMFFGWAWFCLLFTAYANLQWFDGWLWLTGVVLVLALASVAAWRAFLSPDKEFERYYLLHTRGYFQSPGRAWSWNELVAIEQWRSELDGGRTWREAIEWWIEDQDRRSRP